jgi:hypothetical protein
MFSDLDWCNIYHVCIGSRDNIFLCPPGTIFNDTQQGCMDRYDGINCNGTRAYYKPSMNREKRAKPMKIPELSQKDINPRIPQSWKKSYEVSRLVSLKISIVLLFFIVL